MKNDNVKYAVLTNRILLGLVMLIAGVTKLFVKGPDAVTGMLTGFGFPIAAFFAWVLILSEIIFGLAIIANYRLKWTTIPPIIIMVVATILTFSTDNLGSAAMHLAIAANYWVIGSSSKR